MCEILNDAKWLAKQMGLPKNEVRCSYTACNPADGVCYMGSDLSEADLAASGTEQVASFYDRLQTTVQIQAAR
ncbi:MAG: hypothetical protein Q8Q65_00420 [bacterium]|nr:hypothetical protein [bacterium]